MTAEAALTKLSYLLGKGLPLERVKELMTKNLCGEMTVLEERKQLRDSDLLTSIASSMNLSSSSVSHQKRSYLYIHVHVLILHMLKVVLPLYIAS